MNTRALHLVVRGESDLHTLEASPFLKNEFVLFGLWRATILPCIRTTLFHAFDSFSAFFEMRITEYRVESVVERDPHLVAGDRVRWSSLNVPWKLREKLGCGWMQVIEVFQEGTDVIVSFTLDEKGQAEHRVPDGEYTPSPLAQVMVENVETGMIFVAAPHFFEKVG